MKTSIILVRHGQSLGNANNLLLGHTDADLSELGYKQANKTAEFLKDWHIDTVYSSDLIRAAHTAEPNARLRGLKVTTSKQLREIFLGEWENITAFDAINNYGDMYEKEWLGKFGTFTMPGGENTMCAAKRFYDEMERICKENEGKTILVAAHAAVIRAFWGLICDIEPEKIGETVAFPTNASYSLLEYDGGIFNTLKYSCDDHLQDVGVTGLGGVGK